MSWTLWAQIMIIMLWGAILAEAVIDHAKRPPRERGRKDAGT
jgi:hypothetical protein